jgi:hemolysin activation/secretion protein
VTKWGDRLDYQFLTTSSLEYLQAHSLSYRYPFSWGHRAQISGSWAKVKGDFAEVDQIDLTGRSAQVTGRYEMPLPKLRDWTHAIDVGVEAKQSKSVLMIRNIPVSKSSTEIVQFLASYHGQAPDAWGSTSFEATIYESPGGLTGQNKDSSFGPARRNTPSTYRYGTFMLERRTNLILGVSLRNEARYQMSNNNLLGSEQFGAGGWETVRGYDERESSGDEGWLMRHEIWSPSFSFGEWATENKIGDYRKMKDQLQGFLFWDYAVTMNRRLLPSENPDTELSSLGAGMRYRVSTYLSLRADYGFQLLDTGANKRNDGRFHLGMMLSY